MEDVSETIEREIRTLLEKAGFGGELEEVRPHTGATRRFSIKLRCDVSLLIGERGENLISFEHLLKKIVSKKLGGNHKFSIDINDYRMKKLEDLKQDVKNAAKEAWLYKKEVPLRPMSSFERRIVHLLLAEYPDITTESVGQEPNRRVIIKLYP